MIACLISVDRRTSVRTLVPNKTAGHSNGKKPRLNQAVSNIDYNYKVLYFSRTRG